MKTEKPNIIYILADDLGYGDVMSLNQSAKIPTKHLDLLAEEGMVFTDAHSSSAVCTPSRYSILTGRYNWRSTLKREVLGGYAPALIEKDRMTVASLLKEAEYYTACIGKWHLGMNWSGIEAQEWTTYYEDVEGVDFAQPILDGPTTKGFDYFYGVSGSLDMPPYVYIENDRVTELPSELTSQQGKGFWRLGKTAPSFKHEEVLPTFAEKVLEIIEQKQSESFFIYFPLTAPHTPILPTEDYKGISQTNDYGDFVVMCDDIIGEIREKLAQLSLLDNTIIIFTSDNGCSPTADFKELAEVGHYPNHHFRGHKADIYEGGHRIPYMVSWPAKIKGGSRSQEVICQTDLMATLADVLEIDLPDSAGEDSVSHLDLWLGRRHREPLREGTVHHSINGSFSIRQGSWKLELCPGSGGWSYPKPGEETVDMPEAQLYDLTTDVSEKKNVIADFPEIATELHQLLLRYIRNGRSTPGVKMSNTGGDSWQELAAIVDLTFR